MTVMQYRQPTEDEGLVAPAQVICKGLGQKDMCLSCFRVKISVF